VGSEEIKTAYCPLLTAHCLGLMAMNFRRKQRRNSQWSRFGKAAISGKQIGNGSAGMLLRLD
jgi:hypothetical protein